MGLCQTCGQAFVQRTIKDFGPVTFTMIMTVRQVSSLALSFLLFGHAVTVLRVLCVSVVFATVLVRLARKKHKVEWSLAGYVGPLGFVAGFLGTIAYGGALVYLGPPGQ